MKTNHWNTTRYVLRLLWGLCFSPCITSFNLNVFFSQIVCNQKSELGEKSIDFIKSTICVFYRIVFHFCYNSANIGQSLLFLHPFTQCYSRTNFLPNALYLYLLLKLYEPYTCKIYLLDCL